MYQLRVLGGFTLRQQSGAAMSMLPLTRAEAVLAVLAVCGDLGCTRERLIALLWPESDEAHSRHSLRDVLNALRHALGADAVFAKGEHLRLNPSVVTSDVCEFLQSLSAGRQRDAVGVYGGSLLEGFHVDSAPEFERWLDGERSRLAREYGEALEHLAATAERSGAWSEAVKWWARAVEHDPVNSRVVLRHLSALAAAGDRANALKAGDAHLRRLREELDIEPDREVLTGIERLRRGEPVAPPERLAAPAVTERVGHAEGGAAALSPAGVQGGRSEPPAELTAGGAAVERLPIPVPHSRSRRVAWSALAAIAAVIGVLALVRELRMHRPHPYPRTAIAVLPFQNLSADSAHAFFAGGLHDELLTQLAKVAELKVIGRTSVNAYRETSKSLRQIGEELAVGSIVEGSVQVVGDRLRVIVQLVDPMTEAHLWSEHYDRTLEDAFAVQSDIAERIVAGVGAMLTSAEASAIAAAPTQNAEAYQLYLQGLEYYRRPREGVGTLKIPANLEAAQLLFERALALDSAFALAHAALSLVHGNMYIDFFDPSPARALMQRREAKAALRLAPDLPQAHLAMGVAYYGRSDFGPALEEFGVALRGAPNDADAWEWVGYAHRGLGDWDNALAAFEQARRLDPRDVSVIVDRGNTLEWVRRYDEAIAAFRQALTLAPDVVWTHIEIGWTYMKWRGRWDTLREVVASLPLETWPEERLWLPLIVRQPDTVLALLRVISGPEGASGLGYEPRPMLAGWAYLLRGDSSAARVSFDSAVTFLDSVERARPDDWRVHAARGTALAWLGRREDALREARWLERSNVYRTDQYRGRFAASDHSVILARLGETDAALAELERLLARPSHLSVYELRLNPWWDPIRHDPRFQALLVKYANREAP